MHIDVLDLLGALAGGFLGATFGALIAFVFTGLAVLFGIASLLGGGGDSFLNIFAWGPIFGPHISFAAGVGAAAYAHRRGWLSSGRDIGVPLVSLGKPSVLLVGAAFGVFGHVTQQLITLIPWLGGHTDTIALTVVVAALVARLAFGRGGVLGRHSEGLTGWRSFTPTAEHVWIGYQQSPLVASLLGLFLGGLSAWASVTLLDAYPEAGGVIFLGFGISAASLLFLQLGVSVPVTHHMTIVSAVAVSIFAGSLADFPVALVLVGAVAGAAAGLVGELFSRFWLIRGDTHIDPPASAIWPLTTLLWVIAAITGVA